MFGLKKKRTRITILGTPQTGWRPKIKVGEIYCLVKEPNNEVDDEAIMVKTLIGEKVGYVANSSKTVARGTFSAGRLYDKIDDCAKVKIKVIMQDNGYGVGEVREC